MDYQNRPAEQAQTRQHQRFSWQAPQDDDTSSYTNIPQHIQPEESQPQPQPQINTNVPSHRHFSYAQTPAEHVAFVYTSSANDPPMPQTRPMSYATTQFTPIDPRPQSMMFATQTPPAQAMPAYAPPAYDQDHKAPLSPVQGHFNPQTVSSPISPIQPQPAAVPQMSAQQSRHARQLSNLLPINTNLRGYPLPPIPPTPPSGTQVSPLPNKTLATPISASSTKADVRRSGQTTPSNRKSFANEPYSPHGFASGQTNNIHAIFSPDAAHGPNGLDFSSHQPGQITHPNMESKHSPKWTHSLCACSPDIGTCMTGLFCPCILYGRTSHRLSQKSAKKDPTDMLGHSSTNGHCMLMSLACGFWWLFPMVQRTRIRHAYKLEGGLASDLLHGCCCCCCVAVQNEREVTSREEASRRWAGPASTDVYTKVSGMVYKPQQ